MYVDAHKNLSTTNEQFQEDILKKETTRPFLGQAFLKISPVAAT